MAGVNGIGGTGVRIAWTGGKASGIATERLVIAGRTIATAEATDKPAARTIVTAEVIDNTAAGIIRIAAGVGVPTERISRATGEPGVTTAGISNVTGDTGTIIASISRVTGEFGNITAGLFRITGDFGVITKGICGPIAKFDGTTNDIFLQDRVTGTGPLPNITGMDIPAALTKGEAGAEHTDARVIFQKYERQLDKKRAAHTPKTEAKPKKPHSSKSSQSYFSRASLYWSSQSRPNRFSKKDLNLINHPPDL